MKKTNIRTMIRQIVREEVAMAINEVVTELKQPSLSSQQVSQQQPKNKIVEKKTYAKNSILNEIMNETAMADEWKQMGGETYTSNKVDSVLANSYGDLMNDTSTVNADAMVASMGVNPKNAPDAVKNIFTKDYSSILKKSKEKSSQKYGG